MGSVINGNQKKILSSVDNGNGKGDMGLEKQKREMSFLSD